MDRKEVDAILERKREILNMYDISPSPVYSPTGQYALLVLSRGPIEHLTIDVYKKIEKGDINLEPEDFGRGEDECNLKPVLTVKCVEKEEIEPAIEKLISLNVEIEEPIRNLPIA